LNEANAKDLEGAQQLQDTATKRLLSAAASKSEIAKLKATQLRYAEAATYYQQAAELVESIPRGSEEILALYLHHWGFASYKAGNYHSAVPPFMRALAIREKVLGLEHPDTAISLSRLTSIYKDQGRYTEAEPLYQRALTIWEKAYGPEDLWVAVGCNNLADLYRTQRRYAEAEPLYQRALAIREKVLGADHPDVAISLSNMAELYRVQGQHTESEPFFKRALAIGEKTLGIDHPTFNNMLKSYIAHLHRTNRLAEAKELTARIQAARPTRGWLGLHLTRCDEAPRIPDRARHC
jgi:tetratricopeptide (TPR) repeat protein